MTEIGGGVQDPEGGNVAGGLEPYPVDAPTVFTSPCMVVPLVVREEAPEEEVAAPAVPEEPDAPPTEEEPGATAVPFFGKELVITTCAVLNEKVERCSATMLV